ncbi:hypothetical protein EHI8A_113190 [Entamoeba histolytica HM-1:IMSS-B]|uniref:TLDc domain-containing protein n=6 Tax=Entamoeba histolytica TaxID=5759 RepID=C4LSR4_ENTH1|nr:hypothetical protein EHI_152260 [Entamoeba histolytica HM-1:IMSS]EMD49297.1 Hypothetical protein EHI5A_001000 [Entamoeba histolytica KU27]EMH74503.1 hypothetical protein EHI8A_113190 [Entamoeba histolytica HM-1:IMSS-B]EMS10792.1 hypothetical protein KM1_001460 [Entamoeba histolytica HM-3:IMSS]ENY60570.1 hypothetical protein EHI7A_106040 [Entamoeba histolytica HM-1:IMSS-A]GAT91476.1 hypothetical protein CL6EHI_152260 [Entamoeba histolytica]|eukprot:XP_656985.1 hypothetical protein EHI_152260 [Entamoeba histolytica HM-1:IMSS]
MTFINTQINKLKQFVGLDNYEIIFDSDIMEMTRLSFVKSIEGRKDIAIVIINNYNHIYGCYQKLTIKHAQNPSQEGYTTKHNYCVDPYHFIFSLLSDSIPPTKWMKVPTPQRVLNQIKIMDTLEILPTNSNPLNDYIFCVAHAFGFWKPQLNEGESAYTFFKLNEAYINAPTHLELTGINQSKPGCNTYSKITRLLVIQFY